MSISPKIVPVPPTPAPAAEGPKGRLTCWEASRWPDAEAPIDAAASRDCGVLDEQVALGREFMRSYRETFSKLAR